MTDANRRAPHHDWRPAAKIKRDTPIKPQRSHKSHQSHRSRYHLTSYILANRFLVLRAVLLAALRGLATVCATISGGHSVFGLFERLC